MAGDSKVLWGKSRVWLAGPRELFERAEEETLTYGSLGEHGRKCWSPGGNAAKALSLCVCSEHSRGREKEGRREGRMGERG